MSYCQKNLKKGIQLYQRNLILGKQRERERENDDDCKAYDDYKIRTDLNLKTELKFWLLHFICQKKSLNDIELKVINSIRNQHIEDIAENLIQ